MANNAQKTPLAKTLPAFTAKTVIDQLQLQGKELPVSIVSVTGWIVVVKFEIDTKDFTLPQITVPVFMSNYDYLPLQAGDKGVVMSIDTYLGGVSGLGGGTAQLGVVPNLTPLGFVPVGNKTWPAPTDPNKRVVQGPKGAALQTMDGALSVVVDKDSGKVLITGELWINGKKYLNHEHTGVQTGSGISGGVTDP
jgi:hypothetical protein